MTETKSKTLVLDIETKPAKAYVWRMFKENISNDQLIEPTGILMIGAKWLGDETTYLFTDWEHGQRKMLQGILEMINEADAIITYNGDKFDIPHITTGLLIHELPAIAPVTHIDLFKFIRNKTRFDSKKLGFVGPALGIGEKLKHDGFQLWVDVIDGKEEAREKMSQYCLEDVKLTEELYERIKGHIPNHPSLGFHNPEACPTCGSKKTQRRGKYFTRVFQWQRYQCTNCGSWFKANQQKIKTIAHDDENANG